MNGVLFVHWGKPIFKIFKEEYIRLCFLYTFSVV